MSRSRALILLLPGLFSILLWSAAAANTSYPSLSPASSPPSPATTPSTADGSTLDPRQLTALHSMGFSTARDPCSSPSPHDNATACDSAGPFRQLVSLRLANCTSDLSLSATALRALSTLRSLAFENCPIAAPTRLPPSLAANLHSFTCNSSLRRLTGVWLSRLQNLTDLTVVNVPVATTGPAIVLSQMRNLRSATISAANLSGVVPHHWHAVDLVHLDLSDNHLRGRLPSSISVLGSLQTLNLSYNELAGTLPDTIGDLIDLKIVSFSRNLLAGRIPETMSQLSGLIHLDLSSNKFNGSVPEFLSELRGLKILNLEDNNFGGVIPFNASFVKRLDVFKIAGNANLCYNRTLLSPKLQLGVAPCDKYGMPVSPPPARSSASDTSGDDDGYDDDGDGGSDDDGGEEKGSGGGQHGPSKVVLGVAIALSCFVFLVIFLACLSKVCG